MSSHSSLLPLIYLFLAILFIVGIKQLSSPKTARNGNLLAAFSMLAAILITAYQEKILTVPLMLVGIIIGGGVGLLLAYRVKMTDMPQLVALFNGMGGGAAALVESAELFEKLALHAPLFLARTIPMTIGTGVGCITFSGSMVAFGKLQGILGPKASKSFILKGLTSILAAVILISTVLFLVRINPTVYEILAAAALVFGIVMVLPIGGADMPVVISLLNSFTGLSVAFAGFVLRNNLLIISGTLVGASGTLLTQLMCKAMNRSLSNVLFGAFGAQEKEGAVTAGSPSSNGSIKQVSLEDAAVLLAYSKNVVIVPGYGLAVAQAQHQIRDLADLLGKKGIEVKYAIHPVAGRMPGHMNVLLAEANVPYPQLHEMEEINPEFPRTDLVLVVGANDVVNPAARVTKTSPIYGMPILNVDQAEKVIVLKRGMSHGFAGIENELFYNPKTYMLFGDARETLQKLITAVKEV